MPDIIFIQETEAGYENEKVPLHIPESGTLQRIPYE